MTAVSSVFVGKRAVRATSSPSLPLTERILAMLPGRRRAWIVAWALVPFAANGVLLSAIGADKAPLSISFGASLIYCYLIVFAFWAAARFAREVTNLEPIVRRVSEDPGDHPLSDIFATTPPLVMAITYAAGTVGALVTSTGEWLTLAMLPLALIVNLPPMAAVWGYFAIVRGLKRLGAEHLRLDPFPPDRSLGMQPLGRAAFVAFATISAALVPAIVVAMTSPVGLVANLMLFLAIVVTFFASLWGIHKQMMEAREKYIAHAQALYAEAYEPVRRDPTLRVLAERMTLLSAAETLGKRAESIQRWPFDEGTLAKVAGITTSVGAIALARVLLVPFGL